TENHPSGCRGQRRPSRYIYPQQPSRLVESLREESPAKTPGIVMTFKLPEDIATRPIAIMGAGTLGRRIALMLATRGAEVRLYARSAATRDAGVAFAKEQLPAVLAKLPGGKAGAIVGVGDKASALKDAWIVFESVPEDLELKKDIFKQVDALSDADAILASNSSSYSSSA